MPARTIAVTDSSNVVPGSNPGGWQWDASITNTGAATAYLDTEQQATPTTGVPLSAGSTVIWQAGRPLWVTAPAATSLTITENSGAIFDAGAVASQILSQGLAGDIAQQINGLGVPSVDAPITLLDIAGGLDGGTVQCPQPGLGSIDCSTFASLQWTWQEQDQATNGTPWGTCLIGFHWYAPDGVTCVGRDHIRVMGDNGFSAEMTESYGRVQVRGPRLVITVQTFPLLNATFTFQVTASLRNVTRNSTWLGHGFVYTGNVNRHGTGLDRYFSVETPPNMAQNGYIATWIPVRSGRCSVFYSYNATVPGFGLDFVLHDSDAVAIGGVRAAGAGANSYTMLQQVMMPDRPVQLFMRNKGTAALVAAMQTTFVWEGD